MTDYKNLKLIATSNPHIRGSETTQSIMRDVIIAMCPALIWAVLTFGPEALVLTAQIRAGHMAMITSRMMDWVVSLPRRWGVEVAISLRFL